MPLSPQRADHFAVVEMREVYSKLSALDRLVFSCVSHMVAPAEIDLLRNFEGRLDDIRSSLTVLMSLGLVDVSIHKQFSGFDGPPVPDLARYRVSLRGKAVAQQAYWDK